MEHDYPSYTYSLPAERDTFMAELTASLPNPLQLHLVAILICNPLPLGITPRERIPN